MIDFNKVKNWNESIKKYQNKLQLETDFKIKQGKIEEKLALTLLVQKILTT